MKKIAVILSVLLLGACASNDGMTTELSDVDIDNSPKVLLGNMDLYLDRLFSVGGLKKIEVEVNYYTRVDAVCLGYRVDFNNFYLFLDRESRQALINGYEQYKEDYNQRNLRPRGSRQTKRAYGTVDGFLVWMVSRFTVRARGNSDVEIGYHIKNIDGKRAAFFTINQRETYYEDPITRDNNRTSPEITFFLTRSQADDLVEFLDPQTLQNFVIGDHEDNQIIDEY